MHYTGPVVRPPHEIGSIMLEVTVGCTHNSCRFCNFYQNVPFRIAPTEQIEADLAEARAAQPNARRVYALGGDPFSLTMRRLRELSTLVHRYLPNAVIGTYARITSMRRKSIDDLIELRERGYNDLVIGIESGDDEVLRRMNKGYDSTEILEACGKLEQAGINYYAIFLGGLAGRNGGSRNARNTLSVLNKLHPSHLYMTSVAVLPGTPLAADVAAGSFVEATERERIEETLALVRGLENPITLYGQSVANPVNFTAELPRDRDALIQALESEISQFSDADEARMRRRRTALRGV